MLHRSIAENVVFGARDEPQEVDVWDALESAAVAEFVRGLPDGLETIVGERGARLSGGQRQRLALARALYRKPNILLLDEATSALDPAAEERIADMLRRLKAGFITVLVAHDGPLLRIADRTILVEDGTAREVCLNVPENEPRDT
jgi:ABC-type bacteriocin/lantibiotic exporter with double-glycine peptidase domain